MHICLHLIMSVKIFHYFKIQKEITIKVFISHLTTIILNNVKHSSITLYSL